MTVQLFRDHLNHTDRDQLIANKRYLTPAQIKCLENTAEVIHAYPHRFDRSGQEYPAQSALIAMSDWEFRDKLCSCSTSCFSQSCRQWKFCHYCAHLKRMELQDKLLPALERRAAWHITITFDCSIDYDWPNGELFPLCWDAAGNGLRKFVSEGIFKGAQWVEEIGIQSYVPRSAFPHVHALVECEEITMEVLEMLNDSVQSFRRSVDARRFYPDEPEITCAIDTLAQPLVLWSDRCDVLSYFAKPIDLVKPYKQQWESLVKVNRHAELNMGVRDFLNAHCGFTIERSQLQAAGTFDGRTRSRFVGVPCKVRHRKNHRLKTRELLKIVNAERG
jgi:hypothetical protein